MRGFEERFDPTGFTLPAEEIKTLDPVFQWTLHGVREALRSARLAAPLPDDAPAIGLVLGNLSYPTAGLVQFAESTWFAAQAEDVPRPPDAGVQDPRNRFSSGLPAHLAAQALNLRGDAFALDAACASSLYAIKLACDRLQDRRADVMVAGAVNRTDDLFIHIGFCALQAMSRRGESRPFAADADGLVPAEGAAFVVLKRLEDAIAAGDEILGVIRGIGLSNDGNAGGFLSPAAAGQIARDGGSLCHGRSGAKRHLPARMSRHGDAGRRRNGDRKRWRIFSTAQPDCRSGRSKPTWAISSPRPARLG